MEDTTKYLDINTYNFKTKKNTTHKRPVGKLSVVILVDSMKPISIMTSEAGFEFIPDYDTFIKKHPDYRISPKETMKMPYSEEELNSFRVK